MNYVRDASGFRAPFDMRQVLEDRLARRYRDDRQTPQSLSWFSNGRLVSLSDPREPLLLFGDALGRDVLSRLLCGGRYRQTLALAGVLGALPLAHIGGIAGTLGGRIGSGAHADGRLAARLPGRASSWFWGRCRS
jgi:ABC-type dipeptide/oligopeptide/nickel transport system permease subunit